jgi:hypothetical protein
VRIMASNNFSFNSFLCFSLLLHAASFQMLLLIVSLVAFSHAANWQVAQTYAGTQCVDSATTVFAATSIATTCTQIPCVCCKFTGFGCSLAFKCLTSHLDLNEAGGVCIRTWCPSTVPTIPSNVAGFATYTGERNCECVYVLSQVWLGADCSTANLASIAAYGSGLCAVGSANAFQATCNSGTFNLQTFTGAACTGTPTLNVNYNLGCRTGPAGGYVLCAYSHIVVNSYLLSASAQSTCTITSAAPSATKSTVTITFGANLTPAQITKITDFLNNYTAITGMVGQCCLRLLLNYSLVTNSGTTASATITFTGNGAFAGRAINAIAGNANLNTNWFAEATSDSSIPTSKSATVEGARILASAILLLLVVAISSLL